jgi:hypothetical protein
MIHEFLHYGCGGGALRVPKSADCMACNIRVVNNFAQSLKSFIRFSTEGAKARNDHFASSPKLLVGSYVDQLPKVRCSGK